MNTKSPILVRLFRSLLLILNLIAVIWLLLCLITSKYNPAGTPTLLSLFSFTCIFAVAANTFCAVFWLFSKKKKRALISIIALAISWSIVKTVFGISMFGNNIEALADNKGLKIMTWNVHLFDLGEWTKDKTTIARILQLIEDESPDVLCLQEYFRDYNDHKLPYTDIIRKSGYNYEAFALNGQWNKNRMTTKAYEDEIIDVGIMVFSKYPIQNIKNHELPNTSQGMLSVDVIIDSNKIYNVNVVHLTSVKFADDEMDYIDKVKNKGIEAENRATSKNLLKKLIYASAQRANLANEIADLKRRKKLPMIICGDFNDMPGSYVYSTIKGNLKDAFVSKGFGIGRTFSKVFPTLRIDYIFYDPEALQPEGFKVFDVGLSDHKPIMANFTLK